MASFEDLLQCSVCLERFTSPKALPCLHTFCLSCLKGIIKDAKTLDCPTCRKTHQVSEHGAAGFPDNLVIVNLLDMVKEIAACSDCGSQQALSQCEHCQQEVCPDCRVAHNLLKAEIATLIDLIEKTIPEKIDDEGKESARSSLAKILEAETNVHKGYTKAVETLTKRRDEFLRRVKALAKFQKAIVEEEKGSVIEGVRKELANCQTIQTLQELKNSLSKVEAMVSEGLSPDMNEFDCFGEVTFGGDSGLAHGGGLASAAMPNSPILATGVQGTEMGLPSNVDYKAKQHLWKLVISSPPEGCDAFEPTCAIYSPMENAMYCLSDGKVLRYDVKSGVGKIACGIFEAKHMTLTLSGAVILTDEKQMVKITPKQLENQKNNGFDFVLTNLPAGTRATQICSHEKEVIVLDSAESRFLRFSEGGELLGEVKPEDVALNEMSSMCVDHLGRIYVSHVSIVDKKDRTGVYNHCYNEPTSVDFSFECVISIVNIDGTTELSVGGLSQRVTENFEYPFTRQMCGLGCGSIHTRIKKDFNPCAKMKITRHIEMLCVDFDGYVSVTRAGKNRIYVYDSKGKRHCTIGEAKISEFQEPTGLSLMPDGRLVVCDTCNNRILIM